MKIEIDTDVTFDLPGNRKAVVDSLELDDLMRDLLDSKGKLQPKLNPDGTPAIGENGHPVQVRSMAWDEVESALIPWFKEKAGVDLKRSEVRAIWTRAGDVWAKKNASWAAPDADLPTSQPSTDLMSLE